MNKVVHQMLEATGRDLSRQSFLKTVTSGRVFHSNVYPDVSYDGTIRFGARTAHLEFAVRALIGPVQIGQVVPNCDVGGDVLQRDPTGRAGQPGEVLVV